MPRNLTGLRVARSRVYQSGDGSNEDELDFDLAVQQGVAIHGVLGLWEAVSDASQAEADSVMTMVERMQSLHFETGSLEATQIGTTTSVQELDSEIFYEQACKAVVIYDATAGAPAISVAVDPNGPIWFPEPLITSRNITHRVEVNLADNVGIGIVLIYYKIVSMTAEEFLLHASRRQ